MEYNFFHPINLVARGRMSSNLTNINDDKTKEIAKNIISSKFVKGYISGEEDMKIFKIDSFGLSSIEVRIEFVPYFRIHTRMHSGFQLGPGCINMILDYLNYKYGCWNTNFRDVLKDVMVELRITCPNCNGNGRDNGAVCQDCNGDGYIENYEEAIGTIKILRGRTT